MFKIQFEKKTSVSHSVMSDSLSPDGLYPTLLHKILEIGSQDPGPASSSPSLSLGFQRETEILRPHPQGHPVFSRQSQTCSGDLVGLGLILPSLTLPRADAASAASHQVPVGTAWLGDGHNTWEPHEQLRQVGQH